MKWITFLAIIYMAKVGHSQSGSPLVSLVDNNGLTLTNGLYGNIINGQSFQQDALISYKGWQYITYYDTARHVCIGRRKLPNGPWQIIRFTGYHFSATPKLENDAHNTISMGICKKDGTIHLAFDHHGSNLHYRVSVKKLIDQPAAVQWDSTLFSPVRDYLQTGKPVTSLTYPVFVCMPNGNMLMGYRIGGSNNGHYFVGEYDGEWKNFTQVISGDGDYQDPFKGVSPSRNGYINGLTVDAKGILHTSWTWRERIEGAGNRDISYAYSPDAGVTWYNTYKKKLSLPINTFTEGITVKVLDKGWGTMNSQSQTVDRKGVPHIVMYHRKEHGTPEWARYNKDAAYFHYYRKADGSWQEIQTPVIGNRPKLVADKQNDLYLVYIKKDHFDYKSEAAPLAVAKATAAAQWKDWKEVFVSSGSYFNEPQVDMERWASEEVLSVLVQDAPKTTGAASAVRVIDLTQALFTQTTPAQLSNMMTNKKAIKTILRKVADWQIDSIERKGFRWPVNEWVYATFYKGLWKTAGALKEKKYWDQLVQYGDKAKWKVGEGERRYFADDYCIGEVYCALYKKYKNPVMLADFRQMADSLVIIPHTESLEYKNKIYFREWSWCDALFMGPASLVALSNTTGDPKYMVIMDTLFWKTYDYLYDKEEHLYFRDGRFFTEKEANGAKKFWGRGNGWVLAGLARILEIMPNDYANRSRYETLFKEMAAKIASLQQPDGMWRASLLDPASYPGKETSGTGFYCYALAWGINHKLLDKSTYYPVVQKAWMALNECVHPDGKLGYVQQISDKPGVTTFENTDAFGVGGFLLSGTEILKMK